MNQPIKTCVLLMMVAVILAGMMILAGCGDDDPVRVEPDPVVGPESADELMTQFKAAYETRDLAKYLALLDPGFLMILSDETTIEFPDVGATLDFTEEERIHQRMFSGEAVIDPNEDLVPGVLAIYFSVFMALEAWSATDDEDHFPGAVWAPFHVDLLFDRGPSYSYYRVSGTVKIYARAHEIMVGDTNKTYYLMAGVADLTNFGKSVETESWGSVKALFR